MERTKQSRRMIEMIQQQLKSTPLTGATKSMSFSLGFINSSNAREA